MLVSNNQSSLNWNSSFSKQEQGNSNETFNLEFPTEIEIQSDIKTAKKLEINGIEYLEFPSSNVEINPAMNLAVSQTTALSPATAVSQTTALSPAAAVSQTTTTTAVAYGYSVDSKGFMGADFNKAAGLPDGFKIHKSTLDELNNSLLKSSSYLMENNHRYLQSIDIAQNVKEYYNIFTQIIPQKDSFSNDDLQNLPKGYSSTGTTLNNLTILFDRSDEKVTNVFRNTADLEQAEQMQFKLLGIGVDFSATRLDFDIKKVENSYINSDDSIQQGGIFALFLNSLDKQEKLTPVEKGSVLTPQAISYRNQMGAIPQPNSYSVLDITSGKVSIDELIKSSIEANIEFREKHGKANKDLIANLIKDELWLDENTNISKVANDFRQKLADIMNKSGAI